MTQMCMWQISQNYTSIPDLSSSCTCRPVFELPAEDRDISESSQSHISDFEILRCLTTSHERSAGNSAWTLEKTLNPLYNRLRLKMQVLKTKITTSRLLPFGVKLTVSSQCLIKGSFLCQMCTSTCRKLLYHNSFFCLIFHYSICEGS